MRPNNNPVFPVGTLANASVNSIPQWATDILRVSFSCTFSGTAAGTMQLQGSNDKAVGAPPNQFVPTNWYNIGTTLTVAGAATQVIPTAAPCYYEACAQYFRLVYTDTSGGTATGTLQARMESKGL